jgi:signal transduction histidine kinase
LTRRLRKPLGLLGRILGILATIVVAEFVIGAFFYERASHLSLQEDEARRLAEHLVISRQLLLGAPVNEREHLAVKLTTDRYEVHWGKGLREPPPPAPQLDRMRRQIVTWEPVLAYSDLRLRLEPRGRQTMAAGALQLPDKSWVYFSMFDVETDWDLAFGRIAFALVPVIGILAIGGVLVRRALLPLRQLTAATERIGHGEEVMVEEQGTEDVRDLISAFNSMQSRIHQLIEDRTQMLAAVGHDMRTPIARLRLRLEALTDPQMAEAVETDLSEITDMIDSLLAFLGGDKDAEERKRTDLAVMAATIIDDARDMGQQARYEGPDHLDMMLRTNGMRRAMRNLVENALHYGDEAVLSIEQRKSSILIRVEDNGPGIPEKDLNAVLQPFVRLDVARRRNTKGLGLGLAIVAQAVEQEGGRLSLVNLSPGLRAEIELPASAVAL